MKEKPFQSGYTIILLFAGIFLLSNLGFTQQQKDEDEIVKLKERVSKLEVEVNEQAETILKLQKEISELKNRNPFLAIPKLNDKKSLPEGSREFHYNDRIYYMVPLDSKTKLIEDDKQNTK